MGWVGGVHLSACLSRIVFDSFLKGVTQGAEGDAKCFDPITQRANSQNRSSGRAGSRQ